MAKTNYAHKDIDHTMAKALGDSLQISLKAAMSIANFLRGRDANWAVAYLDDVIAMKKAVPFTKFTDGVGHRKGKMAAGRFPIKAAQGIQAVIKSAIANAANQGLDEDLFIVHISVNKAASRFHQGRQRRRMMKQTHVQVVLKEKEQSTKKEKHKPAKKENKETPKPKVEEKPKLAPQLVKPAKEEAPQPTPKKEDGAPAQEEPKPTLPSQDKPQSKAPASDATPLTSEVEKK